MNWQSDFVTPHISQVNNKSPSKNPSNSYISTNLIHSPSSASSNVSLATAMNSNNHYLCANSSNYNRILAAAGLSMGNGGSGSSQSSVVYNNNHASNQSHLPSNQQQLIHNNSNNILINSYTQACSSSTASSSANYPNYLSIPTLNLANGNESSSNNYNNFISNSANSITSSPSLSAPSTKHLITQIIDLIKHLNIKLIAFDFDCTIVTIHTGGQWIDSPEKLAEFVRPCFRSLLPALLQCPDLYVCVVTYSPQEQLIREVLKISMKDEHLV